MIRRYSCYRHLHYRSQLYWNCNDTMFNCPVRNYFTLIEKHND
jgi:hypothetical protein